MIRLSSDFDALNKPIPDECTNADLEEWFGFVERVREERNEELFEEIPLEELSEESFFMKVIEQNYEGLARTIKKDFKKFSKSKRTIGLV